MELERKTAEAREAGQRVVALKWIQMTKTVKEEANAEIAAAVAKVDEQMIVVTAVKEQLTEASFSFWFRFVCGFGFCCLFC